jgi:hypothetical protein
MPLCRLEELLAIVEGLHQVQAWHLGSREQPLQPSPALDQWQRPEVLAFRCTRSKA